MCTNQVPSSGSMYSLHLCVIIEALLVVHGEMFSSDAVVCMYVFMFFLYVSMLEDGNEESGCEDVHVFRKDLSTTPLQGSSSLNEADVLGGPPDCMVFLPFFFGRCCRPVL